MRQRKETHAQGLEEQAYTEILESGRVPRMCRAMQRIHNDLAQAKVQICLPGMLRTSGSAEGWRCLPEGNEYESIDRQPSPFSPG